MHALSRGIRFNIHVQSIVQGVNQVQADASQADASSTYTRRDDASSTSGCITEYMYIYTDTKGEAASELSGTGRAVTLSGFPDAGYVTYTPTSVDLNIGSGRARDIYISKYINIHVCGYAAETCQKKTKKQTD